MRTVDEKERAEHVARIREQGFSVVADAVEEGLVNDLSRALLRIEREKKIMPAMNAFEGHHTVRIYNLLAYGAPFDRIPAHSNILPIVEEVLDSGCLISSLSSIAIDPGETAQPIHADDQVIPLSKPHIPIVCNTMWALTDFTEANGATRLVPGSHKKEKPIYGGSYETVPAEMSKGSVLVWDGSLWHGGGANLASERRTGIAMNYCAGFIRQQENQQLGIPPSLVATFPPRLQELVGYGVYRGLIGHIDKKSPAQMIGGGKGFKSIWDRT